MTTKIDDFIKRVESTAEEDIFFTSRTFYHLSYSMFHEMCELLKEQEGYVSVPFSWLVKFCTHIDFKEPMLDADREKLWKQKLKQQFDIEIPFKK